MNTQPTPLRPDEVAPDNQPNSLVGLPATLPRHRLMEPFRQPLFGLSLTMLVGSGGVFILYDWLSSPRRAGDNDSLLLMLHYGLAVACSLLLWRGGFFKYRRPTCHEGRPTRWIGLLLWLISAYALNREMAVFQESTGWLCGALVIVGGAMVAYAWKDVLSVRAQQLLYAGLAVGWWLFVYMAGYVVQLYLISIPLLIGLGLSIHSFVPLAFAVALGKRLWFDARREEHLRPAVAVGLALPVVVVALFLTGWTDRLNRMEQTRMEMTTRQTSDLPEWILIAQQLQPDWITNRLLLAGRAFDGANPGGDRFFDGNWGLTGMTNLDDVKVHDPLVVIASRLFPTNALPEADNLKLLNVLNADHHSTEEKFWTGRHLTTQNVVSQVRIWPQFRLSYTEKTMQVRNQSRSTTDEALYTFHLPPGSVVSSMSLWVNGREEPARLTTVAKADSAYRQIVNVDSKVFARDPSVVYWREGNRVTVRVFPCRANEDRRVKLGITSPLGFQAGQLTYQNPSVDGPATTLADELIKIEFMQSPGAIESPWLGDELTGNTLTHRGRYTPEWTVRFAAPALSTAPFVLDGRAYHLEPYKPLSEKFISKNIYLDVNAAWTKAEFATAFRAATRIGHSRVWVFDDGLKPLTETDLNATYERIAQQRFSLFPVYRIADPATALLITKGTPTSPTLSDLTNSPFADRMQYAATQSSPIRTFCYGPMLSPYLKTLSELRVLTVMHGDTTDLVDRVIYTGQFLRQPDDSTLVTLPEAGVAIRESSVSEKASISQASTAPDHLARLFTYSHLLQQIGRHYFARNYQTDALIREAQRAHVVSPLSSLVVLETAADYERFGIEKDASGLDNATLKQEGAVPEPHEWALLAMVAVLIGWMLWKKHYAVA